MSEPPVKTPHALEAAELAGRLEVDPEQGLAPDEARRRRKRYGENRLIRQRGRSALAILVDQFRSVIVLLLGAAALLSAWLGDWPDAAAIAAVLVINAAIGFVTELRAARSMEALRRIAEVRTRVRRGGAEKTVNARALVPGDVVVLEAGDVISADLRLTAASNLHCDESVLTGESTPVRKDVAPVAGDAALADRTSMAFKGAAVVRGSGFGVVAATGMATEIGRISELAESAEAEVTPLERRLDALGHRLIWLTLVLAVLAVGAGLLQGRDLAEMVKTGVALAVAAVPEGLPVVATLSLARGMWRMAERNALVSRLSAVETLGAVTLILTDKTGTLTENRMTVAGWLLDGDDADAEDGPDPEDDPRVEAALRIGALCNNANLGDGDDGASGDPMEVALLRAAAEAGMPRDGLLAETPEAREHAFDPELKMMATIHEADGGFRAAIKGAPEAVLERCVEAMGRDGARSLEDADREDWMRRAEAAAREGQRLLALAERWLEDPEGDPYQDMTLVGFVRLRDPLRADVPDAIAAAQAAGVRVVMVTGDHADTAAAIAEDAGLRGEGAEVLEGAELAALTEGAPDPELAERIAGAQVFARVSPEAKLRLVELFQDRGEIVAMTGDGVNDAPALKKADIGVAMGGRGTEVAREAAHIVLKDDAFPTIVAAMREGRTIFENIRRFVVYVMSRCVSEMLAVGAAVGLGLPAPLLPLQILYLNVVTGVFPALALGLGPGEPGLMRRPPRDPDAPTLDRERWALMWLLGAFKCVATLGAFAVALARPEIDEAEAVTVAFLTLALAQMWNVFNLRDPAAGLFVNSVTRNPYVWGSLALCLGLIAAALWAPGLSDLLQLPSPGPFGLGLAAAASLLPLALGQIALAFWPRRAPETGEAEAGGAELQGSGS